MLRLAGAIMIILSGTMIGFSKSARLKCRQDSLEKIIYSLRIMENEIGYGKMSMDVVFEKIAELGGIFLEKNKSETAGKIFSDAVCRDELKLEHSDIDVLMRFSGTLGTLDTSSQVKNIQNTIKSLEILKEDARENFLKYGKMYRSIGILTSILVVIVLI